MKILCLGAGYTSSYLARNFSSEHDIAFMTRDGQKAKAAGLVLFDGTDLPDLILDTIPALIDQGRFQEPPYHKAVAEIFSKRPETRMVHISSTSVYAEGGRETSAGELPWFDEDTAAVPSSSRGENRLRWEGHLRDLYPGLRVLRSSGIYGPGRSLALRFQQGDFRRAQSGNRVVSRIHVHDLARLCLSFGGISTDGLSMGASAAVPAAMSSVPDIVIGVDQKPSPNRETFLFLEELLGIHIPGEWREASYEGRFMRSLYAPDLLGGVYRFGDFRAGFRHSLENASPESRSNMRS